MKINRSKGNLQNQLQKMLQAGMENVDGSSDTNSKTSTTPSETLRVTAQSDNATATTASAGNPAAAPAEVASRRRTVTKETIAKPSEGTASPRRQGKAAPAQETPRPNAAMRREVPDRNAKYAGEPIKSVGCRMPQSLYARMLQYKAMNDTQLNRITLNDIIIEAVDAFLEERQ